MPRGISYEHEQMKGVAETVEIEANDNKKKQSSARKRILQEYKENKRCALTVKRCKVFIVPLLVAFIWQQSILVSLKHQFWLHRCKNCQETIVKLFFIVALNSHLLLRSEYTTKCYIKAIYAKLFRITPGLTNWDIVWWLRYESAKMCLWKQWIFFHGECYSMNALSKYKSKI